MNNKQLEKSLKETQSTVADLSEGMEALSDSTNKALSETDEKIQSVLSGQADVLAAIQQLSTPSVHVKAPGTMESQDFDAEEGYTYDDSNLELSRVESVDDPLFTEKMAMLKFMEEPVTVFIHEDQNEQADSNFFVGVNGDKEYFFRGQNKTVKRKFIEGLARAKPVGYSNDRHRDQDGVESFRWRASKGLRYQFQVVEDRNPEGSAWLQRLLSGAA